MNILLYQNQRPSLCCQALERAGTILNTGVNTVSSYSSSLLGAMTISGLYATSRMLPNPPNLSLAALSTLALGSVVGVKLISRHPQILNHAFDLSSSAVRRTLWSQCAKINRCVRNLPSMASTVVKNTYSTAASTTNYLFQNRMFIHQIASKTLGQALGATTTLAKGVFRSSKFIYSSGIGGILKGSLRVVMPVASKATRLIATLATKTLRSMASLGYSRFQSSRSRHEQNRFLPQERLNQRNLEVVVARRDPAPSNVDHLPQDMPAVVSRPPEAIPSPHVRLEVQGGGQPRPNFLVENNPVQPRAERNLARRCLSSVCRKALSTTLFMVKPTQYLLKITGDTTKKVSNLMNRFCPALLGVFPLVFTAGLMNHAIRRLFANLAPQPEEH